MNVGIVLAICHFGPKSAFMDPRLLHSPKYQDWLRALQDNGLTVKDVEEKYTRYRHDGQPLFSLLLLNALSPEGDPIPPVCFLKGAVVSVLVCFIDRESGERYALLVRQRRICNGGMIYETVAGMVDGNDSPHETAVRETIEETGVQVQPEQVIALNDEVLFCSTGTSDERMFFYFCEIMLSREEMEAHHAKEQGLADEHERIYTHLVPLRESLSLITNVNGLLNVHLYLRYRGISL
jgi:8-oxo-dGTP pyrophosphatase MutT (NUDIX family)